jgi:hypothetical protein
MSALDLAGSVERAHVRSTRRVGPDGLGALVVGFLAAGAAIATLVATRHGPQLSPDSVTYLSVAHNTLVGRGFVDLTGTANTTFAPGFPAVLAFGQLVGLDAATAARALNAASFGAIVVLAWILLSRHIASRTVALAATAIVVVSPALLDVSSHTWSEPMFCVVALGFILVFEDALRCSEPTRQRLLLAAAGVLAGVGFMIRYAGATLILVGIVMLLVTRGSARVRIRRIAVFSALALPLPILWLLRNATSGAPYLLGPRVPVHESVLRLLGGFANSILATLSYGASLRAQLGALAPIMVLAAIGLVVAFRRRQGSVGDDRMVFSLQPIVAFIVCYSLAILVSGRSAGSSIDSRIVMPVLVPLVVVAAWAASNALSAARESPRLWPRVGVAVVATAIVVAVIASTANFLQKSWDTGSTAHGYATATLASSPLARAVSSRVPSSAIVTTNSPWTLYAATGHEPIVPTPAQLYPSVSLVPASSDELADAACRAPVFFAWYARSKYPSTDLGGGLRLTTVVQGSDGVLYAVRAPRAECHERGTS